LKEEEANVSISLSTAVLSAGMPEEPITPMGSWEDAGQQDEVPGVVLYADDEGDLDDDEDDFDDLDDDLDDDEDDEDEEDDDEEDYDWEEVDDDDEVDDEEDDDDEVDEEDEDGQDEE
jgi:hypothetical protein